MRLHILVVLLATTLFAFAGDTNCPAYPHSERTSDAARLDLQKAAYAFSLEDHKAFPITIPANNFIDEQIFGKMSAAGIEPAPLTNDAEFLRRVSLDLIGRIPAPDQVKDFVTRMTGTLTIAANGQTAVFLDQIQGLGSLSKPFQGILRLSSSSSISVIGLRARYNERNDFLITTTTPANEADPVPPGLLFFPHIADSGGYTTQFILFSARPGSPSSGAIQFLSQSGTSLNLTVQ
jgi:hypothetical protein